MKVIYRPRKWPCCAWPTLARKIAAYLASGDVWVDAQGAAIAIIQPHSTDVFEIMNIALAEHMGGQGHSTAFLQSLIAMLKARGARAVEIGTGNSNLDQLALCQKLGFRITSIGLAFLTTTRNRL